MAFGGRSIGKTSEETFDFVCTDCADDNRIVEAVKYCIDCSGYCCQQCMDTHNRMRSLKHHNLMDVNQGKTGDQSSRLPEFPTERCRDHAGKVMDMYCQGHDVIGCTVCFVKDHSSCDRSLIHSIPDMIDTLFNPSESNLVKSLLKDTIVSMDTVSQSKDAELQNLIKTKNKALDKVDAFQKSLETILKKAGESTRNEVMKIYKQQETGILEDKNDAGTISEDLKTSVNKLNQCEGNRAQRFACTKDAQRKIKQAADVKVKHEMRDESTDIKIDFIPDTALMESLKVLHGIGQVKQNERSTCGQTKQEPPKQAETKRDQSKQGATNQDETKKGLAKPDQGKQGKSKHEVLYKIKTRSEINIKLSDDSKTCYSFGCCLTEDNKLIVTDYNNKKLKRINIHNMTVESYFKLDYAPYGVCSISANEVAVACIGNKSKIQFVTVDNKMTPTRQLSMNHSCYGIACKNRKLYVTDWEKSLYIYDLQGTLLSQISNDNTGNQLFDCSRHVAVNDRGSRVFVGGGRKGLVCLDGMGKHISSIQDTDLGDARGVCLDDAGNVFVAGNSNVIQYKENGQKVGAVVEAEYGLSCPQSVCYHPGLHKLFVTMLQCDVVKVYELE